MFIPVPNVPNSFNFPKFSHPEQNEKCPSHITLLVTTLSPSADLPCTYTFFLSLPFHITIWLLSFLWGKIIPLISLPESFIPFSFPTPQSIKGFTAYWKTSLFIFSFLSHFHWSAKTLLPNILSYKTSPAGMNPSSTFRFDKRIMYFY